MTETNLNGTMDSSRQSSDQSAMKSPTVDMALAVLENSENVKHGVKTDLSSEHGYHVHKSTMRI